MVTVAFSDFRQNMTEVSDRVMNEGIEVLVVKRSKPAFVISPASSVSNVEYDSRRLTRSGARGFLLEEGPLPARTQMDQNAFMTRIRQLAAAAPKGSGLAQMSPQEEKELLRARFDNELGVA